MSVRPSPAKPLLVVCGVLVIVTWVTVAVAFTGLSLMATLMANDSGAVSTTVHTVMILLVLGGEVLVGAAGIPLGLACFVRNHRKVFLLSFLALLLGGLGAVGLGILIFSLGLNA